MFVVAVIIGIGVDALISGGDTTPSTSDIARLVDYRASDPAMLTNKHVKGAAAYNPIRQNCMGNVYAEPIENVNAVHTAPCG